jgi:hypothetical protein
MKGRTTRHQDETLVVTRAVWLICELGSDDFCAHMTPAHIGPEFFAGKGSSRRSVWQFDSIRMLFVPLVFLGEKLFVLPFWFKQ